MEPEPRAVGEANVGVGPIGARTMRVDRRELAAIFAGGFLGAVARSALAELLAVPADRWPWATFAVNITAALALGYIVTRLRGRLARYDYRRSFLASGFCGALSTFSTMMVELLKMIDAGDWGLALGYGTASVTGGLAAIVLASTLAVRVRWPG